MNGNFLEDINIFIARLNDDECWRESFTVFCVSTPCCWWILDLKLIAWLTNQNWKLTSNREQYLLGYDLQHGILTPTTTVLNSIEMLDSFMTVSDRKQHNFSHFPTRERDLAHGRGALVTHTPWDLVHGVHGVTDTALENTGHMVTGSQAQFHSFFSHQATLWSCRGNIWKRPPWVQTQPVIQEQPTQLITIESDLTYVI